MTIRGYQNRRELSGDESYDVLDVNDNQWQEIQEFEQQHPHLARELKKGIWRNYVPPSR